MKPTFLSLKKIHAGFLALCIVLASVGSQPAFTQNREPAVSGCKVGVKAPGYGSWTWAANSHVKVYILAADFKSEEIPYLLAPLQSWNAVAEVTGSRVIFAYAGNVSAPQDCENCLTIMRGKVFERKRRHATELQAASVHSDQIISYAKIVIDPAITNLAALTNAIAHELGHNFGLLDCFSCKDRSTVMNQMKVVNVSNGMEGPTECDIAQVKRAYEELKTRIRPSPVAVKIPVDDGEEPVDDDTPVIVPKP